MATNSSNTPTDSGTSGVPDHAPDSQAAANLIREKVARAYENEPDAKTELAEAKASLHRSQHQQFMYDLSTSGKNLAAVQTEWHNYYQGLSADQKHLVWQEFYSSQSQMTSPKAPQADQTQALARRKQEVVGSDRAKTRAVKPRKLRDARSAEDVQAAIRHSVSAGGKLETKHHLQSLLFGLGMGSVVLIIFLFGFFNEVVIAPFIQPSRTSAATPLIVNSNSVAPTANPEVIIPKINVEIPVVYDSTSTEESTIQKDLERGVVQYPTTAKPGQNGNVAIFGHSSNNIFNKGKYKFAFVLLHTLLPGDTFYLTYQSKVYVYKVITRDIVDPSNVGVLNPVAGKASTATLITCDPPGTSLRRLVVVGEQISPDPAGNAVAAATPTAVAAAATDLPGNGPTLFSRLMSTTAGKAGVFLTVLATLLYSGRIIGRRLSAKKSE